MVTAAALLLAMLLAIALGRRLRAGVLILALLSLVWLSANRDFEGPILFSVGTTHGLVLSDLVGLGGLGVAVWQWRRARW